MNRANRDAAITAALYARFVSRQDESPAMKAVAAMRNQFGGHALHTAPPAGGDVSKGEAPATDGPQQAPEAEEAGAADGPKASES